MAVGLANNKKAAPRGTFTVHKNSEEERVEQEQMGKPKQEYPLVLHMGEENIAVHSAEERDEKLAAGYTLQYVPPAEDAPKGKGKKA